MPGADPPLLERLLDVETGKDDAWEAALAPRSPLAPSEAPSQLSHLECLLAEEEPMPAGRGPSQASPGCGIGGGVSGTAAAARCRQLPPRPLHACGAAVRHSEPGRMECRLCPQRPGCPGWECPTAGPR